MGVKVELGIDELDFVKIDTIEIRVNGDLAEASALGTLACKTSDDAPLQGGFSAKARIHLQANLATCMTNASSIDIIEVGESLVTLSRRSNPRFRPPFARAWRRR